MIKINSSYVWPDAPAQLPQNLRKEFLANRGNEGTRLVSETAKVASGILISRPADVLDFALTFWIIFGLR